MLDIIVALFESLVSFLETLIKFVQFVVANVGSVFSILNNLPTILKAPCIMALSIIFVLGIKKAVLA